jgi:hypothetical protein
MLCQLVSSLSVVTTVLQILQQGAFIPSMGLQVTTVFFHNILENTTSKESSDASQKLVE